MLGKIKGMLGGERSAHNPSANPAELGKVAFGRDLEIALADSESSGKPIFLLFQEIPGCSTCTTFGKYVLSSEKVLAAVESDFVAVAINNRALLGHDKKVLKRFDEPLFNNPVVRLMNSKGEEVISHLNGIYNERKMLKRVASTLVAARTNVVRFINSKGEDIIPRADGIYNERDMLKRMASTLEALSKPLPESLQNIGEMRIL